MIAKIAQPHAHPSLISVISVISLIALTALILVPNALLAQDAFEKLLDESPRHQEWVEIEHDGRIVHAFVVYPEVDTTAKTVVVIHENRGLNIWVRTVADRLAEKGYIAIAPDLLSGSGPDGGRTKDFASSDDAREAIYELDPDSVTADLAAAAEYVRSLPAANGKVSVAGFCWGGSQSFRFATNYANLEAVFVFYGRAPENDKDLARINAPVYGFYGGNDARTTKTVEPTESSMQGLEKQYESTVYPGAGHGFMRRGVSEAASAPDAEAADLAWERWLGILDG